MRWHRRYGLVGRNGTGKTTLLRALSGHQIRGTPPALQILHVEQEVRRRPARLSCAVTICLSFFAGTDRLASLASGETLGSNGFHVCT